MKDFAKPENENKHGKFAVAVALEELIVGHVPKNLIKTLHQFMKILHCTLECKLTGKHVNRVAGYSLEIPVQYRFSWTKKQLNGQKRT